MSIDNEIAYYDRPWTETLQRKSRMKGILPQRKSFQCSDELAST